MASENENSLFASDVSYGSDDSVMGAELMAETKDIENVVNDYYNSEIDKRTADQTIVSIKDMKQQWEVVDGLNLLLYDPKDISQMTEEQRERRKKFIDTKAKVYNFLKPIADGYKIEGRMFLKRLNREKSSLESMTNKFEKELRGLARLNDVSARTYKDISESLTDEVLASSKFSEYVERLREGSGVKSRGMGLKQQHRELGRLARELADKDDSLSAAISKYDGMMVKLSNEIRDLDVKIAESPQDSDLLNNREKKSKLYSQYEIELENLQDKREETFEKFESIRTSYKTIEKRKNLYEVAVVQSKRTLNRINNAIAQVEDYIGRKEDIVIVQDHMMTIDSVDDLSGRAELISNQADVLSEKQYEVMTERYKNRTPTGERSSAGLRTLKQKMDVDRREEMENFKRELRKDLYR